MLLLGTNNLSKITEIKPLLNGLDVLTLETENNVPNPNEIGNTLKQNAYIKATEFQQWSNLKTISDDSGLFIRSLNWNPGIYTARYASDHNETLNIKKILKLMNGQKDRFAVFKTCICFIHQEKVKYFYGELKGIILKENQINNYTYNDIFYVPELNKTLIELTFEEKLIYSHRCLAVNKFLQWFKNSNIE